MNAEQTQVELDDVTVRLGGPGWLERYGFIVTENPAVAPGLVLLVDQARLLVPDLAEFRWRLWLSEQAWSLRRDLDRILADYARRIGVVYGRDLLHRPPRRSDHEQGRAMDVRR